MAKKLSLIVSFVTICFTNFRSVLKALMHFTETVRKQEYLQSKGYKNGIPTVDILDIAPNLDETISDFTFLDGTSRVIDIVVLKALARRFPNCEYLEIGSWRGESLVNVASVAKHCTSLSLSKEEMRAMGFDEKVI